MEPSSSEDVPRRPQQRLSNSYLVQALDALQAAGSAPLLYVNFTERELESDEQSKLHQIAGRARWCHQNYCRATVLFSALAAEAYVNEFIAAKLPAKDAAALDKLSTPDKYATGVQAAEGSVLFTRGADPHNAIVELFKLRSRLVHPKPGWGPVNPYFEPPGEFEALFTPTKVARFLVQTARAATVLVESAYPLEHLDHTANFMWEGRAPLEEFALTLEKGPLPAPSEPFPHPRLADRCLEARSRWLDKQNRNEASAASE